MQQVTIVHVKLRQTLGTGLNQQIGAREAGLSTTREAGRAWQRGGSERGGN